MLHICQVSWRPLLSLYGVQYPIADDVTFFSDSLNAVSSKDQKKGFANTVETIHTSHLIRIYTIFFFLFCYYSDCHFVSIFVYAEIYVTSFIKIIDTFSFIDGRNSGVKGWISFVLFHCHLELDGIIFIFRRLTLLYYRYFDIRATYQSQISNKYIVKFNSLLLAVARCRPWSDHIDCGVWYGYTLSFWTLGVHYENTPIQIYWKFHHRKLKVFS